MATQPSWSPEDANPRRMQAERVDLKHARTDAERMMQLGHPVPYRTVRTLLADLHDAYAEIAWLRSDRNRWQEAYCEARLEGRRGAQRFR